jgi:hypothetical protein
LTYVINFTEEEIKTERWKDIPGYEGAYEASTIGRIRTKEVADGMKIVLL